MELREFLSKMNCFISQALGAVSPPAKHFQCVTLVGPIAFPTKSHPLEVNKAGIEQSPRPLAQCSKLLPTAHSQAASPCLP